MRISSLANDMITSKLSIQGVRLAETKSNASYILKPSETNFSGDIAFPRLKGTSTLTTNFDVSLLEMVKF